MYPQRRDCRPKRVILYVSLVVMDVSPLRAVADRMDEVAAVLRARAGHIALGAATTHWYSPAARTYFDQIDEVTAQLIGCAARIDALAERVRRHIARILADLP